MTEASIERILQVAVEHHQAGRLQQAEGLYRQILARQPDHADALHLLGVAAAQVNRLDMAVEFIRRAIAIKPGVGAYHNSLCHALVLLGRWEEAVDCGQRALALEPGLAEAHNNLGPALQALGRFDEAVACYQKALALHPNDAKTHNNLGLAFNSKLQVDEAIACYQRALALMPESAEVHNNLAVALKAKGRLDEAIVCYQKAVSLKPDYAEAHNNLGNVLRDKGRLAEAMACYQRALSIKPDFAEAHLQMGRALLESGQSEKARSEYGRAMELKPDCPAWRYEAAAQFEADTVATAPESYIRELFDGYAATFDTHLVDHLGYRGPGQMLEAVLAATERRWFEVLDLGCGTGLCGVAVKPYARRLVGVDLAPAMIQAASRRGIYDQLLVSNLLPALNREQTYDLVLAGDLFIYVGDLSEVMPAVAGVLRPGGLFAFTTEDYEGPGFRLQPHLRFAHSMSYIRQWASRAGLTEVSAGQIDLRREGTKVTPGWVVVLGKK